MCLLREDWQLLLLRFLELPQTADPFPPNIIICFKSSIPWITCLWLTHGYLFLTLCQKGVDLTVQSFMKLKFVMFLLLHAVNGSAVNSGQHISIWCNHIKTLKSTAWKYTIEFSQHKKSAKDCSFDRYWTLYIRFLGQLYCIALHCIVLVTVNTRNCLFL